MAADKQEWVDLICEIDWLTWDIFERTCEDYIQTLKKIGTLAEKIRAIADKGPNEIVAKALKKIYLGYKASDKNLDPDAWFAQTAGLDQDLEELEKNVKDEGILAMIQEAKKALREVENGRL